MGTNLKETAFPGMGLRTVGSDRRPDVTGSAINGFGVMFTRKDPWRNHELKTVLLGIVRRQNDTEAP